MENPRPPERAAPRQTEPLPATIKPALILLVCLATVVASLALAAYVVDRVIYG